MRATSGSLITSGMVAVALFAAGCSHLADNTPVGVASYTGAPSTDTTHAVPPKVRVSGRILGVTFTVPTQGSADSMHFEAVRRARIRVMQNVLVNGEASQVLAVEMLSDDSGGYVIRDLPGGYYVVYAYPPAGSAYSQNWSYLAALDPEVKLDVYVWKK
jgi:hypothetical protein